MKHIFEYRKPLPSTNLPKESSFLFALCCLAASHRLTDLPDAGEARHATAGQRTVVGAVEFLPLAISPTTSSKSSYVSSLSIPQPLQPLSRIWNSAGLNQSNPSPQPCPHRSLLLGYSHTVCFSHPELELHPPASRPVHMLLPSSAQTIRLLLHFSLTSFP